MFNTRFLILLLAIIIFSLNLEARRSKKERTKQEAIELIREYSTEVSVLAGVDPMNQDSLQNLEVDTTNLGDEGEDLEELMAEDDVEVDLATFSMLWLAYVSEDEEDEFTDNGINKQEMMDFVMDWLGTPYKFAADSKRRIDCSAFTRRAFRHALNIEIPRTAYYQYQYGDKIERSDLEFGDMVFFKTRNYSSITHVGIFLGDDLFVHASSSDGVTVSSLNSSYYSRKYRGARRFKLDDIRQLELQLEQITSTN